MASEGPGAFRRSFRPDVAAATGARRALDEWLLDVDDDLKDRSYLAMSEVVTNSVTHARLRPAQLIDVQVALSVGLLRIDVFDEGAGFQPLAPRRPSEPGAGGWGLWLVDQLTDRWGVDCSHSTRVWLEFDRGLPGK